MCDCKWLPASAVESQENMNCETLEWCTAKLRYPDFLDAYDSEGPCLGYKYIVFTVKLTVHSKDFSSFGTVLKLVSLSGFVAIVTAQWTTVRVAFSVYLSSLLTFKGSFISIVDKLSLSSCLYCVRPQKTNYNKLKGLKGEGVLPATSCAYHWAMVQLCQPWWKLHACACVCVCAPIERVRVG